jgi:hypothetical protein
MVSVVRAALLSITYKQTISKRKSEVYIKRLPVDIHIAKFARTCKVDKSLILVVCAKAKPCMADLVGQRISVPRRTGSLTPVTLAITEGMVVVNVVLTTSMLDGIVELLYITRDAVCHMDCTGSSKRDDETKSGNRGELRELHGDIEESTVKE